MARSREELQAWYRDAMQRRIAELQALRGPLQAEEPEAFDQARDIGQALRGSGATFGFPDLTAVARLLETSADRDTLRRVEGLIAELYLLRQPDREDPVVRSEWLLRAADLPLDAGITDAAVDTRAAWQAVVAASGLSAARLADAVARYFDLGRSTDEAPGRSALRLVPQALVAAGRITPLEETPDTITVATSEPTSLRLELELRRVAGRSPRFRVASPGEIDEQLTSLVQVVPEAPTPRPMPAPTPAATRGAPLTERDVLVVDDEESARLVVRSLLEKKGFDVSEAEDGVEALARLEEGSFGLVVADLNMPRLDGLELIWEMRDDERLAQLPVIVVTGEMDEVLETQLMEEGASDYIRKPVDPRLFLARVEASLRRAEV